MRLEAGKHSAAHGLKQVIDYQTGRNLIPQHIVWIDDVTNEIAVFDTSAWGQGLHPPDHIVKKVPHVVFQLPDTVLVNVPKHVARDLRRVAEFLSANVSSET